MKTATTITRAAAVMSRAHQMTRAIRAKYPTADYRVTLAAALRIAWEDALAPAAIDAWNAMTPEEQVTALTAATWKAAARDLGETDSRGNAREDSFLWARLPSGALNHENVAPIVSEAYPILIDYLDPAAAVARYEAEAAAARAAAETARADAAALDGMEARRRLNDAFSADDAAKAAETAAGRAARNVENGTADRPIAVLITQAVRNAARRINRAAIRNGRADSLEAVAAYNGKHGTAYTTGDRNRDNEPTDRIHAVMLNAAPGAERFTAPDAAAIIADTIDCVTDGDRTNRRIIDGMMQGYTRRDIGEHVGMSHTAVGKRVKTMRARYEAGEALYSDNYAAALNVANA